MIHLANGQIYFDSEGQDDWFNKNSDNEQLFKQIEETSQCAPKPCSSSTFEELSASDLEKSATSPVMGIKFPNFGVADRRESLKIRWDLVIKRRNNTTRSGWNPEDNTGKDRPTKDDKTPGDKDKPSNKTTTNERTNTSPLVQVYVVASGNGGAHTNIGDGGYYGRNNGHVFTGREGYDLDERNAKYTEQSSPREDWSPDGSWNIGDQKDAGVHIGEQYGGDFGMPLSYDKLGEASTKYRLDSLGLNSKPLSLRERLLQNWNNRELVKGSWRLWFRK